MRTAIVADTNSGITPEEAAERGITLIPMPFLIDGAEYREGEDCTQPFFFARLAAGAEVATSQPSPGGITERWDRLLEDHDAILHFPMSASLSGSCQTAKALALDYPGKVFVVDNRRISVTLLQSLRQAQRLLAEGKSAEEVHRILEDRAAGESWQAQVQAAFPDREVELAALPLSICCHIGGGALAIACAEV